MSASFLRFILAIAFCGLLFGCANSISSRSDLAGIRVSSVGERTLVRYAHVFPNGANAVTVWVFPNDMDEFKRSIKWEGAWPSEMRGEVVMTLEPDGGVKEVQGCFEEGIGTHWTFYPEVQEVTTWRSSPKLTIAILRRFSELGLL